MTDAGLWTRCNHCGKILYVQDIIENVSVCPACNFHFRLSGLDRLTTLFDEGQYRLIDEDIYPVDRLNFVDSIAYSQRLLDSQKKTGLAEAVINAVGQLGGIEVIICSMDFAFMGGSMGSVVGEKITRAAERALAERKPLIIVSCSGGARMQEGVLSLMQLLKTSASLAKLDRSGIPFISVLTDPTTGGTTASFAMLGDINVAEPNALIGFAGARVSAGTIAEELPPGFQRAEFLFAHGFVDRIAPRAELRAELAAILEVLAPPAPADGVPGSVRRG